MAPICESYESLPVQMTPEVAIGVLVDSLRAAGYKPSGDNNSVTVSTGSNFLLRLWGTMLPWGRKNIPIGMTVTMEPSTSGTVANVHAYDRLGWYFDARTNLIIREESEKKMRIFSAIARRALVS